jgi:hypothetical protein
MGMAGNTSMRWDRGTAEPPLVAASRTLGNTVTGVSDAATR